MARAMKVAVSVAVVLVIVGIGVALADSPAWVCARAYVVRSYRVSVYGRSFDHPALRDHDWVLVVHKDGRDKWYVDPTFADFGFGWNLEGRVRGELAVPKRPGGARQ